MPSGHDMTYDLLSRTLLGVVNPFDRFEAPAGMRYDNWYPYSLFSTQHVDLAEALVDTLNGGGYMVELGSFIGNSATTWARAMERRNHTSKSVIICIDTWLGDANMWQSKGQWLGTPATTGQPRLFE